jgi:hypothetical protein
MAVALDPGDLAHQSGQLSQLFEWGPSGPRNVMKIGVGTIVGDGSGEIELTSGAREAEQLFDPERA